MKQQYITAVLEQFQTGADADVVLRGLKAALKRRGHERLYGSIIRGVLRILSAHSTQAIVVRVANNDVATQEQSTITNLLKECGVTTAPEVVIDPTLIGGFVVETTTTRHDASYKTKLVTLYRSITQNV